MKRKRGRGRERGTERERERERERENRMKVRKNERGEKGFCLFFVFCSVLKTVCNIIGSMAYLLAKKLPSECCNSLAWL